MVSSHLEIFAVEETTQQEQNLKVKFEDQLECESRALAFDHNKHKLLNSELKKLYTAITRARVNVWIFDEDKVKRAPVFEMFIDKHLVNVVRLDENVTNDYAIFAERSSIHDWNKQGHYFYEKGLWKLALKCSERGNNELLKERCLAQLQGSSTLEMAREWKAKRSRKPLSYVQGEFMKAAKLYLECGLYDEAKICLKNSNSWFHLADICEKQNQVAIKYIHKYKSISVLKMFTLLSFGDVDNLFFSLLT